MLCFTIHNSILSQLNKLSDDNEKLREEAKIAKDNYGKLHEQYTKKNGVSQQPQQQDLIPDSVLKNSVVELFTDVQNNYMGRNVERTPYKTIVPVPFLNKMVNLFPFLKELKRV